jgi:hypothetical protein
LLGSLFDSAHGGSSLLWNTGRFVSDCMAQCQSLEDTRFHSHSHENLKCHMNKLCLKWEFCILEEYGLLGYNAIEFG